MPAVGLADACTQSDQPDVIERWSNRRTGSGTFAPVAEETALALTSVDLRR